MEERKSLYKEGDKVKIIKYGHLIWFFKNIDQPSFLSSAPVYSENDNVKWIDISPEMIGKEAIIGEVTITQGIPKYALLGVNKTAWYTEEQLELINE